MGEVEIPNPHELHELKERAFTRRAALTTAIFAVILAISSLGASKAMKEMLLSQQQASDQWAFYQAKVIREHLYLIQKMQLEAQLLEKGASLKADVKEKLDAWVKKAAEEEKRYKQEKKDIEKEARKLEQERDLHRTKDPYFEYGEVLLQIAIVMGTVAILANSQAVIWFAMVMAGMGALFALNGFFLFFRLPFFHH